MDDLEIYYR